MMAYLCKHYLKCKTRRPFGLSPPHCERFSLSSHVHKLRRLRTARALPTAAMSASSIRNLHAKLDHTLRRAPEGKSRDIEREH